MRIVSLLSSATEILFALGLGDQVLAISHECDYPPEATKLPRATRSLIDSSRPSQEIDDQVKVRLESGAALYDIDRDLIRDLQPDLIITQAQCDVCAVKFQDVADFVAAEPSLTNTKIHALNPNSLAEVLADVQAIGKSAQASATSIESYVAGLLERVRRIQSITSTVPLASRPRVVVIEWTLPLMSAGNWTPGLVELAGGVSLLAEPGRHSGYLNWQKLADARPDCLIVAPCGFNLDRSLSEARQLRELPGYQHLPAVTNRRAFVIDGNAYLNRSGPRLIDSLEILAHLIRPELFDPPSEALAEGRAWSRLQ